MTTSATSNPLYKGYADQVAQTFLANQVGSTPQIGNALATAGLNTAILVDPLQIEAYRSSVADQMNAQSGGSTFTDLSTRIADVVIDDTVQGAATLEVHLIDPYWLLLLSGFIQVDESGYLWPPIDINFPSGTDCVWRLCQCSASVEVTSGPNVILTFEDRITSVLRQMNMQNGIAQGQSNQTLGGFFKQLIDSANQKFRGVNIRLVELIDPQDPNYTVSINQLPSSATAQGSLRTNPNKSKTGLTALQQSIVDGLDNALADIGVSGVSGISMLEAEQAFAQQQMENVSVGQGGLLAPHTGANGPTGPTG